jgi:hypothetical protein
VVAGHALRLLSCRLHKGELRAFAKGVCTLLEEITPGTALVRAKLEVLKLALVG